MESFMPNLGYIIFDLDGTLIDSMEIHSVVFAEILASSGIKKEFSKAHYMATSGQSLKKQFLEILKKHDSTWQGDLDELVEQFNQKLSDHATSSAATVDKMIFEDTQTCIPILKQAGYILIVSSSGSPELVQEKLRLVGILEQFDLVLGTDENQGLYKGKSHFNQIKIKFNLTNKDLKENAVFVGDGVFDIQVAKKAGVASISRIGTNDEDTLEEANPDFIIDSFHDLIWLLKERSASSTFRSVSLLNSDEIQKNFRGFRRRRINGAELNLKDLPKEEFEIIKTEYASLRNEILRRIDIRHQIVSLHLIVAGTFLTIGAQPDIPAVVLLVYPVLTMFISASWARNDSRIKYIGSYIRDYVEILTKNVLWETHRLEKVAKPGFLWLSRLRIFSTMGLFLVTQILALGLAFSKLVYSPEEIILLVLDVLAIVVTAYFTLLRRGV
jgi:phosphoglycolate phosphatase-like HAD superfamily hydrolase